MKLNKSYILLISLISIFLILSVSAVSAADSMDNKALADHSALDIIDADEINDISNEKNDVKILSQSGDAEIYANESDAGEDPVDTTVEAEDKDFKYAEEVKVPVCVKDDKNNTVNITQNDLNITLGTQVFNFTLDNESNIVLKQLNVGEYLLNIRFLGNANYKASEKSVTLNVTEANTTIEADDLKVKTGSEILIPIVIKDEFNNTVEFKESEIRVLKGEEELTFSVNNSTIKINNLTDVAEYDINIQYLGNINYFACEKAIKLTILANNTIKANDTIKVNNHTKNVTVPIVITNTEIISIYDEDLNKTNTTVNVTNVTIEKDDLILTLRYDNGTENTTVVLSNDQYDLIGEPGNYTINFITEQEFDELIIVYANGTLNETNKTIKLIYHFNAKIEAVNLVVDYQDGSFIFKLIDADTNEVMPNTTVTVTGVNFYTYKNGSSIIPHKNFTSDANGLIVINNIDMNSGYDFGAFIYNFTTLAAGKYNLTLKGADDGLDLDKTFQITVNKVTATIVAYDYKQEVGSGVKYIFRLINANTKKYLKLTPMQFMIKLGNNYTTYNATTNMTGQAAFNINLYPGTYPVTIVTNSSNVKKTSTSKKINVIKKQGVLTANNRTLLYGCGPTVALRFTDKKTGKAVVNGIVKVRLYTTSKKYIDVTAITNKTGHVKFNAALSVGKHKYIVSSNDTNYTASSLTRYITIKKSAGKFTVPKMKTFYRSGKIYRIKLTNTKNKSPMFGAQVNIKVFISKYRYYNYTGTTDGNGYINLKVSYKPGVYNVVASNVNDTGYTAKAASGVIRVTKHPIVFKPVSMKVAKGKAFQVKVVSRMTKKVLSNVKVNIRVYTGTKYQTYTKLTNKKGYVAIKVTQKVGNHKVVITPVSTKLYVASKFAKALAVTK